MTLWVKFCTSKAEADADRTALERDALRDLPADEVSIAFECHSVPFGKQLRRHDTGQPMLVAILEVPDHPNGRWWHEWLEENGWIIRPLESNAK